MTIRTLAEIGASLEKRLSELTGNDVDPLEQYLQIENLAIAILDSESGNYAEGVLEAYLQAYLMQKRLELGVRESDLC